MIPNPIVVTGTDTDVGKTVFAAALAGALGAYYWKPIQAGLESGGDRNQVATLSGLSNDKLVDEAYRLNTPCSPHRAAEIDDVQIDLERLWPPSCRPLVIEGAGGALVPVTRDVTFADVFMRWMFPVVIVARTTLGTINHSLLTIEALRTHSVPILGVAFVGNAVEDSEATIARIGGIKRLGRLPWLEQLDQASLANAFAEHFRMDDFA